MEVGDIFYIHVLDKTLEYKVELVKVIEPYDTSELMPVEGKDYVSLLTCTPLGINSHRLIVRGERVVEYSTEEANQPLPFYKNKVLYFIIAGVLISITAITVFVIKKRKESTNYESKIN